MLSFRLAELLLSVPRGINASISVQARPYTVDPVVLLARTYFDSKEFRRCAYVLENRLKTIKADSKTGQSSPATREMRFLYCYARFLAGEKSKQEEFIENGERVPAVNKELTGIYD